MWSTLLLSLLPGPLLPLGGVFVMILFQIDLFKNYFYSIECAPKNFKKQLHTKYEDDSRSSRHKIFLDRLTCHQNQSIVLYTFKTFLIMMLVHTTLACFKDLLSVKGCLRLWNMNLHDRIPVGYIQF